MATPRGKGPDKPKAAPKRPGSGHGGSRPGSGKKPSDVAAIRRDVERQMSEGLRPHLPMVLGKLLELIRGVEVQEARPDGSTNVYTTPPDIRAIREFLDRTVGKARQPIEVSGPEGGAIEHSFEAALAKAYGDKGCPPGRPEA